MVRNGITNCPNCGGSLRFYDMVSRVVRTKNRDTSKIYMRRLRCSKCNRVHRELPEVVMPYKQYETILVESVMDEIITPSTFGYEDYPCEATMKRWIKERDSRKLHVSL